MKKSQSTWKRICAAALIAASLTFYGAPPANAATASSGAKQVTVRQDMNVRAGAGTSYAKVGEAKKGARFVYISSKTAANGKIWYQIQFTKNQKAWISGAYSDLVTPSAATATTSAPAVTKVIVTGAKVNCRAGAGASYAKVGDAEKGASFVYLSSKKASNGKVWYQVQFSRNQKAWIVSSYARLETPSATSATKTTVSTAQSSTSTTSTVTSVTQTSASATESSTSTTPSSTSPTETTTAPTQSSTSPTGTTAAPTQSSTFPTETTVSTTQTTASATKTATTTAASRRMVVITFSQVNCRADAGASFAKVGEAKKGARFVYLSSKKASNGKVWYQIQYTKTRKAWVVSSYARLETESASTTSTTAKTTAATKPTSVSNERRLTITADKTALRADASTSSRKISEVKKGASYVWLSSKKGSNGRLWHQIQYSKLQKAWVDGTYARMDCRTLAFTPYLTRTLTIKKGSWAIYTEPSSKSTRVGTVYGGAKYKMLDWQNDGKDVTWYAFNWKGKRVWISRHSTTVSDSCRAIPQKDFSDGSVPLIYLSPSKQPHNAYAGVKTNEQTEMYRVAAELRKILEKEYVCTVYTAPADLYLSLDGRALDAYNRGADVYLAIHSNSDGGDSKKSYGAMGFYQPSNPQSRKLAQNIVKEMGKIGSHANNVAPNVVNGMLAFDGTGYSDVRDPAYYGITSVLAEVEFHDNADSAKWIVQNPKKIARALANSLETTFRLQKKK